MRSPQSIFSILCFEYCSLLCAIWICLLPLAILATRLGREGLWPSRQRLWDLWLLWNRLGQNCAGHQMSRWKEVAVSCQESFSFQSFKCSINLYSISVSQWSFRNGAGMHHGWAGHRMTSPLASPFCHLSVMLCQDVVVLDAGSGFLKAQIDERFWNLELWSEFVTEKLNWNLENDHYWLALIWHHDRNLKICQNFQEEIGKMNLAKDDILYQISQFHGVSVSVGRWVSVEKMLLELFSQQPWQRPPQMRTERMKQQFGVPSAINATAFLQNLTLFHIFFGFETMPAMPASGILEISWSQFHLNEMNKIEFFTSYFTSTLPIFLFVYDCCTEICFNNL